jgi:hypothetical protein
MSEAKVTQYILCKLDGKEYEPGDTYEGSPERIAELTKLGYLEAEEKANRGRKRSADDGSAD